MEYEWLLKDPRWQKKRLEIFQRDQFTCTKCGDQYSTLHVHHFYYNFDLLPWEYPDDILTTYCELCHTKAHFYMWLMKQGTLELKKLGFINQDIESIKTTVYENLNKKHRVAALSYMKDVKRLIHG